jgi:hypothetical protein
MSAERRPGVLTRLLRAFSAGLRAGGYPDSYSGVTSEIRDSALDHAAPYYDPERDHNQLRLPATKPRRHPPAPPR